MVPSPLHAADVGGPSEFAFVPQRWGEPIVQAHCNETDSVRSLLGGHYWSGVVVGPGSTPSGAVTAPGAHVLHGSQGSAIGTSHSGTAVAGGPNSAPRRNQSQRHPTVPATIIAAADSISSFRIIRISCVLRSIRSIVCYPGNSTSLLAMCK